MTAKRRKKPRNHDAIASYCADRYWRALWSHDKKHSLMWLKRLVTLAV